MSLAEVSATASLDLGPLLGDWRNTNTAGSIARIVCAPAGDGHIIVHCHSSIRDWGAVAAPVFTFTFDGKQAAAFSTVFDFGFEEVRLQANVKSGVLVVATFNQFRDQSRRSNYFDREFFYRI
jgi:hypothetical protein